MAITASVIIAACVIGLAIIRYYTYQKGRKKDFTNNISKYWQNKVPSISFDSLHPSPPMSNKHSHSQTHQEINEMTRILKSSFSWPEATLVHQHKQQPYEKDECASTTSFSSLSNSSTMEQIAQPASLMFSLRWDEVKSSLFVHIIHARNLFVRRRNTQAVLIDSYVRIELIPTENEHNQGRHFS